MTGSAGSRDRQPMPGRAGLVALGAGALGISIALTATSMIVPTLLPDPGSRGQRELRHYFDITADSSLPAWWLTGLLLAAALAHATAGFAARLGRVRGAWCWFVGAAVLAVLSLNEHALLSERLETLAGALVAVTGFSRPVLAAGVVAGFLLTIALARLAAGERGRAGSLLVAGAMLLAGSTAAGALAVGSPLSDHAEWLGRIAGVLLLTAAAMSAFSVTPGAAGVRVYHRGGAPPAGIAAPVPAAVPVAAPREERVPDALLAAEAE